MGIYRDVLQKFNSISYKLKASKYRKSSEWLNNPYNKKAPKVNLDALHSEIKLKCEELGIPLTDFSIDQLSYKAFKKQFRLPLLSLYAYSCKEKKFLEHFVAFNLLDLKNSDRYVDIASENSPFPHMLKSRLGIDAYSQDLSYDDGIHGMQIGSSADKLPISDNWIDKASLQCAFEHFEGNIDTNFIKELSRKLKPGGKCVIIPLYMSSTPQNIYDPILYSDYNPSTADDGTTLIAEIGLGGFFERVYSPSTLNRIILKNIGLSYHLYRITDKESAIDDVSLNSINHVQRIQYCLLIEKHNI